MGSLPKITVTSQGETKFLSLDEIKYCSSQASYCNIHCTTDTVFTISKNLKFVEQQLPDDVFHRIHHSVLVNMSKVTKITNEDEAKVVLDDGTELPLARRRKSDFIKQFINL